MPKNGASLAINLQNLFNPKSYSEFQEGFFMNQPKMSGYYYIFKDTIKPVPVVIVNTSNYSYSNQVTKIDDYLFIVIKAPSFEDYIENFGDTYFPTILELLNDNMEKKDDRNLPYGYYLDENGDLKVDLKRAGEVRKIYKGYLETQSVRKIADEMKTNFSFVRDILHDNEEYARMQPRILDTTTIKRVSDLMAENIRGGTQRKETSEDRIKAARERSKRLERQKEATLAANAQ